jgi:hypothetical protein
MYSVMMEIVLGATPPPVGNVTTPVDTLALRKSVSGPLYNKGMLAFAVLTPVAAADLAGEISNPRPPKVMSAAERTEFMFKCYSP